MNLLKEKRRGKCVGGVETKISGLLINKKIRGRGAVAGSESGVVVLCISGVSTD